MPATLGISIMICCYNSEKRIVPTLQHLSKLKTDGIAVEIILVNNASTDDTEMVARQAWAALHCDYDFKIIDQPVPGVMAAREKGIETARYDYVLFCDDDNWLNEHYLLYAREVIKAHPNVGVIAGRAIGEYEVEPEHWFLGCTGLLSIGPQANESGVVNKPVYGAGCIIDKQKYKALLASGFQWSLSGRKGKSLVSGEDTELCIAYLIAGYDIYYEEKMGFRHFMPIKRMQKDYLKKLCLSGVHSAIVLAMYNYDAGWGYKEVVRHLKKRYRAYVPYYLPRVFLGRYKFRAYLSFRVAVKALTILKNNLLTDEFRVVQHNLQVLTSKKK